MVKYLKNDTIWRVLALALLGSLLAVGSWGMVKVADMPETYVTKKANKIQKDEISKQICDLKTDLKDNLNSKISGVHNRINGVENRMAAGQLKIENKLEKMSDLLIQHMTKPQNPQKDDE